LTAALGLCIQVSINDGTLVGLLDRASVHGDSEVHCHIDQLHGCKQLL